MITTLCDRLIYGPKPCQHGHANADGLCLRTKLGGNCCRCQPHFASMTEDEIIQHYLTRKQPKPSKTRNSDEVRKKLQSEASMRWTAKNKDKAKGYLQKWNAKPEVKERISKRNKANYAVNKDKIDERQRRYYNDAKAKKLLTDPKYAALQERKAFLKSLTPEERKEENKRLSRLNRQKIAAQKKAAKETEKLIEVDMLKDNND